MNNKTVKELFNELHDIIPGYVSHTDSSDIIIIDETHNVGFEIFENEIIVFFFSAHTHFENYSDKNNSEYISRAKEFLNKLFTCTIKHEKIFKGKTLTEERYTFINKDNTDDCPIYVCNKLLPRFIPFLSKHTYAKLYKYNSVQKTFTEMT